MTHRYLLVALVLMTTSLSPALRAESPDVANPHIDMKAYLRASEEAARRRASRRVSEDEFLRMSREPGTIVLDARSKEKYDELHVKGAVNLSFPDITVASLQKTIPDKGTRILIYCNNNFRNAEAPFPRKAARAALNLSTYVALYSYGYENVYELGPLRDLAVSKLTFESSKPGLSADARSKETPAPNPANP